MSLQGDIAATNHGTILSFDSSGFDATRVQNASVVKVGSDYKMLYGGLPFANNYQIGLATSTDGVNWTRFSSDPVISNASSQSWASFREIPITVMYENGTYKLWFYGDNRNLSSDPGYASGFGYATSSDGINWTMDSNDPIRLELNSPSGNGFNLEEVVKFGGAYHAYYIDHNPAGDVQLHAVSNDGIHFSGDAPIAIASGYNLVAATTLSLAGAETIFAVLQKADLSYWGTSTDGVNFNIGGQINLPAGFGVSDITIDNDVINFFGTVSVGNVNWNFDNEVIQYATGSFVTHPNQHAPVNDFDGDGYSDILWRNNSSGGIGYTDLHSGAWHSLGTSSTAYRVAGTGDFNGDGYSDILWRNDSSGDTGYSDLHTSGWHSLGVSTAYSVVGAGDFNGDGFSDILWRNNSSGDTGYSDLHGNAWHGLGASSTSYSVVGVGDFNGDNFSDILWRDNSSGDTGYSDLHGNTWHGLGASSTAYRVVGVGDFNGDGFSDVLWRNNSSGDTGYSDLHGGNAWHSLGASSTAYTVVGVGDYNGDSFSDILWENTSSGDTGYSDLHGNAWHALGIASTAYLVVA
jgi:hypothetical protein